MVSRVAAKRFTAELERAGTSSAKQAASDRLSFTHRREYVGWIEGAKRPETRAKRVVETVRRVREGGAPP